MVARVAAAVAVVAIMAACAPPDQAGGTADADAGGAAHTNGPDTLIAAGPRYAAGAVHQVLLGADYRTLWTTPARVPFLDLDSVAGGLRPVERGGGEQTLSLRFEAPDGREYNFRSVDKDATRGLPKWLRGTPVRWAYQDQTSSMHPAGAGIAAALLEAVDVLHPGPRLVVMPDHPRLGRFRSDFAGRLGWIEIHANEIRDDPRLNFARAAVVAGTDRLLEHLAEDPELHRVDSRAYLRVRLMDILMGDWDRHSGQLRWARYDRDGIHWWAPIPEDRDHAFVSYDGALLRMARFLVAPRARPFTADIPTDLRPLTKNAADIDGQFLANVPRETWLAEAEFIRSRLTDDVIDAAVRQMPDAWYQVNGDRLAATLRGRRDDLTRAAGGFYELIRWRVPHGGVR
jgi:hypothetical protein